MNFLYPLFLAGGLAIALPIVFHLIRRSTKTKVPFSTLRFLEPTPPRLTKKSRLEHLWLLLLRCLILLLLAFAFARPYIEQALDSPETLQNSQRTLFLIDSSASMRRTGAWDRAQSLLSEQVNDLEMDSLAAAYTFDTQVRPIVTFEQWHNASRADRSIQIINQTKTKEPTWKATHLGNALITAVDLLEESTRIGEYNKDAQDWRIIVIGDLQTGMLLDGIQGFEWPKGCVVDFHPIEVDGTSNAGIHAVPNLSGYASLVESEGARVRISNTSQSESETFKYGWVKNSTDSAVVSETDIYLPPGKSRVVDVPQEPTDFTPDILRISGDDHSFDNTAWRVPLRARQSQVLYFGKGAANDSNELLFYLQKAFQQTLRHEVSVSIVSPDQPLLEASLENTRLVVIGAPLSEQVAGQIRQLIEAGTTALLPLHTIDIQDTLRSLTQDSALTLREGNNKRYALFGEIDFKHPLFSPFADPRFSDFTKIHFWNHTHLELEGHETARVIAQFDNQLPAITQFPLGQGALFTTSFGWQPQLSQFALSTKFVPFLYSLLDFEQGIHEVKSHYIVGEEVDLTSLTEVNELSIETPNGETMGLNANHSFNETSVPGIYTINTGTSPIRFAVNLHPSESDTAPILDETLTGLGIPQGDAGTTENINPIVEEARRKLKAAEIESSQKYWKWIVLAALVFATLETLAAGMLARRASPSI